MKNANQWVGIWVIILSFMLTACALGQGGLSTSSSLDGTCVEGLCAKIAITEPIILNQPSDITVTVSSSVDRPGLMVVLQAVPNVTFGASFSWPYDAKTNQTQTFHATVTFTNEGGYQIGGVIYLQGGVLLEDDVNVLITSAGAVVNPTIEANPTSDLFLPSTPKSDMETASAQAEKTMTPPPPVAGFSSQQWLEICGWKVDQPKALSELRELSGWLNIKETAVIGEQVNGTLVIGFKDEDNRDVTIQAQIGLCTFEQGWTTDTSHEWNAELHSGTPYETPVSLHFTETGDIPIFIVVLDRQNNRIAGIGRLIYVKSKE